MSLSTTCINTRLIHKCRVGNKLPTAFRLVSGGQKNVAHPTLNYSLLKTPTTLFMAVIPMQTGMTTSLVQH